MYKSGTDVEETAGVGFPPSHRLWSDADVSKLETRKRGVNLIALKVDWNLKFPTLMLLLSYGTSSVAENFHCRGFL